MTNSTLTPLSALLDNVNVEAMAEMPSPAEVEARVPLTEGAARTVLEGRSAVVGPCSIHDPEAALDYAHRLRPLADEVRESLVLVMRVYFEKPRTSTGWKGFVNDPGMDDSFRIDEGIVRARELLMRLAELGLPTASQALGPICPQDLPGLVSC